MILHIVYLVGTYCCLFSRVHQLYKTYKTISVNNLLSKTMGINIFANSCFLLYKIINKEYFIMCNSISVITLESALI
jgi:hypothetical protein